MYIEIISKIYKSVKITICLCVEIKLKMLYNIGNISWKGIMEIKEIKSLRKKAKKVHNNIEKHEKYIKLLKYCKQNLEKLNPVIVDVETTGVKRNDEILQAEI